MQPAQASQVNGIPRFSESWPSCRKHFQSEALLRRVRVSVALYSGADSHAERKDLVEYGHQMERLCC